MGKEYPNVVRSVLETPWAILPEKLAAIRELVQLRAGGVEFTDDEVEARIGAGPARRDVATVGATAVIPIYGVITPKADLMTQMSGGTPIDRLWSSFYSAMNDAEVSSVVFDIDSPGGQTDMLTEFAAEVRAMRGKKPIVSVANTRAASAAYWIGSQADEIVVTPSGSVGSIGVFAAHEDLSKALEMEGVKTTLISAGKYKTEASPFEPLTDEARAYIQERVDEAFGQFTGDVAKGRRVSVGAVREGFGEGRMVSPKQAVKEGMVDGVESMQSVLSRLAAAPTKTRRGQATALMVTRPILEVEPTEPDDNGDQWKQYEYAGAAVFEMVQAAGPIASHSTATSEATWDGPANKARLRNDENAAYYRRAYAWVDSGADPNVKASYKFIHHEVNGDGDIGAANLSACSTGIAVLNGGRTGTTIPSEDRQGVYNHLARHLKDGGREPPPLQSVDLSEAAMSGLSFAARLRQTLGVVESHVADARGLADVRERDRLTGTKREHFVALADALDALAQVRADIGALLADTDPEKPLEEARAAALTFMARRSRERT